MHNILYSILENKTLIDLIESKFTVLNLAVVKIDCYEVSCREHKLHMTSLVAHFELWKNMGSFQIACLSLLLI